MTTPSSRRRADGVEDDATIQRERAVNFDFHTGHHPKIVRRRASRRPRRMSPKPRSRTGTRRPTRSRTGPTGRRRREASRGPFAATVPNLSRRIPTTTNGASQNHIGRTARRSKRIMRIMMTRARSPPYEVTGPTGRNCDRAIRTGTTSRTFLSRDP